MRHLPIKFLLTLYILGVGQNWAHYTAALMTYGYDRYEGCLTAVPFGLGTLRPRATQMK